MSSRRTADEFICLFNSGIERTMHSPKFVKHINPISVWTACDESAFASECVAFASTAPEAGVGGGDAVGGGT